MADLRLGALWAGLQRRGVPSAGDSVQACDGAYTRQQGRVFFTPTPIRLAGRYRQGGEPATRPWRWRRLQVTAFRFRS